LIESSGGAGASSGVGSQDLTKKVKQLEKQLVKE
jgi:hypothetical protein